MNTRSKRATSLWIIVIALCTATAALAPLCFALPQSEQTSQEAPATSANRHIGAIKSINGSVVTLTPDSGSDIAISVEPTARIVRIAPGEKDLKNATPIQVQDLQVGDRILVAGKPSDDKQSFLASSVVVMKHSDLEARHAQDLQDWQKRGVDGLVTAVDAAAGTITISVRNKNVSVHASKSTVIRRYAPDSVKFDDAKPSTLVEIHSGDQVRARGDRSADGNALTADEIVSGSFRNIAGTLNSVDASSSTLSVHDLLSRKNMTVKIAQDSQLHQLPPDVAQRFAARLKRTAMGTPGAASGAGASPMAQPGGPGGASGGMASGDGAARRSGGAPDLQQMLNHMPSVSLDGLHKGDAVIILSTEGSAGVGTAITLLTGVEPILQAAPNASGASILTPWSLSAPSGEAGGP